MIRKKSLLLGMVLMGLVGGASYIYNCRTRVRIPSPESMDNPAVAKAFNRVAGWPQMRLLRWYVVRRILRLTNQGHAVDIGCGPGHLVFELAGQAPDFHLTGIDLSDEVLTQAKNTAVQIGFSHVVDFKKGSAQEIPLPDNSLDLVVSTLSLHHWSNPGVVFDEISRVLRPGGSYLIFDLRRDMAAPFYLLIWFATRIIVPRALKEVNEPLGSRNAAYTIQEARNLMAQSNLTGWQISAGPLWVVIEGSIKD
jgi:ubiquinone/menaquinone biosynthesis C-methylase UbiE